MGKNLISLLKASGEAGTDGQSFRMVDGAADTVKMTDYLVGDLVLSGTLPVDSVELPGAYASGTTFGTINVGIGSYGAQAHQIRKSGTTGFTIDLGNGGGGASVVINSFTEVTPDDFDLSVTIHGKLGTTVTLSGGANGGASVPINWGDPWAWTFYANIGAPSGGPDTMFLNFTYEHDTAGFNTTKVYDPIEFDMARRSAAANDLRYKWFDDGTDATNNTNPVLEGNGSFYASIGATSYGPGHPNNENFTVWLRWTADLTGASGWSGVIGPISITGDNRMEA